MQRARRRHIPTAVVAALLMLVAVVASGCSGSDDSAAAAAGVESTTDGGAGESAASADTASETSSAEDIVLAYTQCLRDEGFDVPDPDFGAGPGEGGGPAAFADQLRDAGIDPDDPAYQAAVEECQSILQGIQQQGGDTFLSDLQDAALEFAKCMREEGIDLPDPDFSQGLGGGGVALRGRRYE